ncbi:PREDICTED: GAS2-like protein 2 [Condylura cristata]|uniref:GAS2-like protein 2 n=1 Tax=Condylura cristata TaxID=143302 RepID=UPI0003347C9B|nr:PREDICTED: GAS2-like protein 2 [Condylura cristata]
MSQPRGHGRRRPGPLGPPVRSIRPFKSSEQYLEAMKEDLAEWLRDLYGLDINAANFLQVLETGLVLCQHANAITEAALAFLAEAPIQAQRILMPRAGVPCNGTAQPGTFQARDNVSNFIQWCRKEMGIQEVLMFETEDLVLRKNVKNVVLCLLELGRRAWRFGVKAPTLVHLEEEIDEELRRELALPAPDPPPPAPPARRACHFRNLDQTVQSLMSHCTCPVQFSMVKVAEGKYRVGNSNSLIFIRMLRNHVMVRVGGGWDTLGHYLDKHDPCRCTSLSHKTGSFLKPPAPPVQHEVRVQDGPSQPQPTMTISRAQSPLPPVDWKTYTSSGRKLRPPTPSSPRPSREWGAGAGGPQKTAPFLRCQEKSFIPSRRQLSAGGSPSSPQSSPTHRAQEPWCTSLREREDRHSPDLALGRRSISAVQEKTESWGTHARTLIPQRLIAKGTLARGPSPLPRPCSPVKPVNLRPPPWGEAQSASAQLSEPTSVRAPSPVKGPTKIPVRPPLSRPPTPGRNFEGTGNGGPKTESGSGPTPLKTTSGDMSEFRHGICIVRGGQGEQKPDSRVTGESEQSQGLGAQEQEGKCPPLSLGRTKEQAIYHSLEEELLANMKLLQVGGTRPQSTGTGVIPRSGVYVPSLGGRWPEPGGPYDKVIQELARGPPPLLKVDIGAWKAAPTSSPKLAVTTGLGSPQGKPGSSESEPSRKVRLDAKGSSKRTPPPGGQNCSAPPVSADPDNPTPPPSDPSSSKAKACPSKGKRTLRRPQRVPSIYKLKLRPRIRPRRDHRPEKRPSRIPKPLAYLHLGSAKVPPRRRLVRAVLGGKGGQAAAMDGASPAQDGRKERKEPATSLESTPGPSEGLGPQQLDQAPLPPEEESWV